MLAVFYGNNTIAVREAAHASVPPDIAPVLIDAGGYERGVIGEAAEGTSLFGDSMCYIIDTPSEDPDFAEEVRTLLPTLAASPHTFIVIEGKLLAAAKKVYEKHAATIEEYTTAASREFNAFALADALSLRDKKKLWLLLHDAFREGYSSEEIIGTLWWQLKTLRLASITASSVEAGMKNFPYNKAKRALKNFKECELDDMSASLLRAYHDARLGKLELDLALEKWVLSL